MKVEAKYVSPQMAEELLATTDKNRNVSHQRVLTLANLMRSGRWQLNGETIIVSKTGKLLDGQHRMFAIIEVGLPQQMLIATGAPDEAFETIDTGRARTAADIAGMEGVSNPNIVTSAAALIWRMFYRTAINEVCSPQTVLDVIERFPGLIKWGTVVAALGQMRRILPPGSFVAALVYLDCIAKKPRLAEQFFEGITKGSDLPEGSPILALRNRIINLRASGGIINATTCWSPVARTLSAMEAGEDLSRLAVEMSHGAIRTPALFHDHVEDLPEAQRIDKMWRGQPRETTGETKRDDFSARVREIRGRAKGG
jgi:hypothetical protein